MSRLEGRYRRLLGVLPGWYRAEREDEMLGTFMADRDDELDLEYGWPGWGEAWALAVLGVRTRLAARGGPPRAVMVGDAVRLVALFGLVAYAALAVVGVVRAWLYGMSGVTIVHGWSIDGWPLGGWLVPIGTAVVAVGAVVALCVGRAGLAKLLAVAGLGYGLVELALSDAPSLLPGALVQVPLWITVGCLLAGFHGEAPAPGRSWLWALAGAIVVLVTWTVLLVPATLARWAVPEFGDPALAPTPDWTVHALLALDPTVAPALAVTVAGVVLLVWARHATTWALALAVAAAAVLPERLALLDSQGQAGIRDVVYPASLVVVGALAVIGAGLAVLAARGVRRLPEAIGS